MIIKDKFISITVILLVLLFASYSFYSKDSTKDFIREECKDSQQNLLQCWQGMIEAEMESKGLDSAFEILGKLYVSEPAFASECHGYAHNLGQVAYEKFSQDQSLKLTPKTSYCGYGFYHGFMETLLYSGGTIKEAQDFCVYAGETLKVETSDAEGACYHGIGHGAVDGSDPRFWGDLQAMVEPGLKLCAQVANDNRERFGKLYRCVSGAYNSLEILSIQPKYKLDIINRDPFSFCETQPDFNLEACYTNMLPALARYNSDDFEQSAKLIEDIKEENNEYTIRSQVMLSLSHDYIRVNLSEPDYNVAQGVEFCRKLSKRSHLPCIEGLSGGHMKYGEPKKEHVKALSFCASSLLTREEQDVCYSFILSRLQIWYNEAKTRQICQQVNKKFQRFCSQP